MIVIGAKGFAKEVLEILYEENKLNGLAFYDDINHYSEKVLFDHFPILQTMDEVQNHFNVHGNTFIIGIGNPILRYKMYKLFESQGGVISSCISPFSKIGHFDVNIGTGTNVLQNAIISNSVKIGIGCIIYYNTVIAHDSVIEDFTEISPGANILGRCHVGAFTHIGSNATVLPGVTIGKNAIIGAGSVVTKNIANDVLVAGVPAVLKKKLKK